MSHQIRAIYGNGVLKPLDPVDLKDQDVVSISIEKISDNGQGHDDDYLPLVAEDGDPDITWEQVRSVLAKLPASLTTDIDRERDERF
jgi:predicted DNA-binding antitoxin AbrB/MazE fold protein